MLQRLLAPGATIAVRGDGLETKHGRVIDAKEIGSRMDDLQPVKKPKEKQKPKHASRLEAARLAGFERPAGRRSLAPTMRRTAGR